MTPGKRTNLGWLLHFCLFLWRFHRYVIKNCISLDFSDNGTIWTARHCVFAYDGFVKNNNSVTTAQRMFGGLVSRFGDVPWPPRSPDLPCCDFFLRGRLKERVYTQKPRILADLNQAITEEVQSIQPNMLTDWCIKNCTFVFECVGTV